jgi:hypothetical protein
MDHETWDFSFRHDGEVYCNKKLLSTYSWDITLAFYRQFRNPMLAGRVETPSAQPSVETGAVGFPGVPSEPSTAGTKPRKPEQAGVLPSSVCREILEKNHWHALLIGISDYSLSSGFLPSLQGIPTADVLEIRRVLEKNYGFTESVILLDKEATRETILLELTNLHKRCMKDDNILVYYAGHGHLPEYGVGIWLPADSKSQESGISNSEIKDRLANLLARRVLLISDSCFSGSFLTRSIAVVGKESLVTQAAESARVSLDLASNERAAREVLCSGNLTPVPNSGTGPYRSNSPFASSLLVALQSVPLNAAVSTTDLFVETYLNVQEGSRDVKDRVRPQRGTLPSHAGGEFFLVRFQ